MSILSLHGTRLFDTTALMAHCAPDETNAKHESESKMSATQTSKTQAPVYSETLCELLTNVSRDLTDNIAKLVAADCADENNLPNLAILLRKLAKLQNTNRLILFTGSRRYSDFRDDSDFDWVIKVKQSKNAYAPFKALADVQTITDDYGQTTTSDVLYPNGPESMNIPTSRLDCSMRFGPLNLILVSDQAQWDTWRLGTLKLMTEAPVTRDRAIVVFKETFRRVWGAARSDYRLSQTVQLS
jgi:hypothetical protein